MSRNRRLAREGAIVALGQIATVIGAMLLIKVITGYLAPEQYGHITLALTVATLIHQVVMGGTLNSIGRYYPIALEAEDTSSFFFSSKILVTFNVMIVLAASSLAVHLLYAAGNHYLASMVTAAATLSILSGINGAITSIQNSARNRGVVAFHMTMESWLKIVLALLAVWIFDDSSVAILASYVVCAALVLVSQIVVFRRCELHIERPRHNVSHWLKKMSTYSWPFVAWGGFTWAQMASDRWALQVFSSSTDVGLYSVVYQLGFIPIGIVTNIVANFFWPILYQYSGDAKDAHRNRSVHKISWAIAYFCLASTCIATVVAYFLHDWIFSFMVSQEYRTISFLLPAMVFSGGLFAASELLALKMMADLKVSAMVSTKIATSILGLLLNMLGAMCFGVIGVVGAQIIFSLLYLLCMVLLTRSKKPHRI